METEEGKINIKYVSYKINKIRWQPISKQVIHESRVFATGTWDNDVNKLSLWHISDTDGEGDQVEGEPQLLCEVDHKGDVTDIVYLNQDQILVSSSTGSVSLYRHHGASQTLSTQNTWENLHKFPRNHCPCTGLAWRGSEAFASIGEDGRICIVNTEHRNPVRVFENADSCTLNGATFIGQTSLAAVNSIGQLKVWDLRQKENDPVSTSAPVGERTSLHSIDKHPTQSHIASTGGEDGTLSIWDMRQERYPVSLNNTQSADIWEVKFHPSHPDNLFTCSQNGSVYHWDVSAMNTANTNQQDHSMSMNATNLSMSLAGPNPVHTKTSGSYVNPWLRTETAKRQLEVTDLLPFNTMPVNSLDIVANTLLCATDGEHIISVPNLVIK